MEFRPCIDIHNGKVKQIVGSSLKDEGDAAIDNFVAEKPASYYANLYKENNLRGGHIILLNPQSSDFYEATKSQAVEALRAYPGGMQIGGGITPDNAAYFINEGASHVIVTSYVFNDGKIQMDRLEKLANTVGKDHLVLDLSCRNTKDGYMVVTDRWQRITETVVNTELLKCLSDYCDEYLIHAVDVEGKNSGIECRLVESLSDWKGCPITYAGGVHSYEDIDILNDAGHGRINMTIGSALDLFGGKLSFDKIVKYVDNKLT